MKICKYTIFSILNFTFIILSKIFVRNVKIYLLGLLLHGIVNGKNVPDEHTVTLTEGPRSWLWHCFLLTQIWFWQRHIKKMVGPIDVKRKGRGSVGYWVYYRNWYQDWCHCGVTNDMGSSPQPSGCGELPRSLVTPQWPKSRYQFLFYHDASKHIKSMQIRVYKQRIAHKTASNQPLWKAWPQTIVTAASLVTSWLPLWCHSDACVTKSWQYTSLKN